MSQFAYLSFCIIFLTLGCLMWQRWHLWHHRVVQWPTVITLVLLQVLGSSKLCSSFIHDLQPSCSQNILISMTLFSSAGRSGTSCDKIDYKLKDGRPRNRSLEETNLGAKSGLKSLLHGNVSPSPSPAMCPPCMSSALSLSCRELLMGWDLFFSPLCPFKPVMAILINLPGCWQPDCSSQGLRGLWVIFLLFQLFPRQPLI